MKPTDPHSNRREFLCNIGGGFAGLALAQMFSGQASALPAFHHPPRVNRVIQLFMTGGASPMDLFDYKPELKRLDGQPFPESFIKG